MSPRTRIQFEQIREKSRKAIMDSALQLFAQNGYHQTSVQRIAQRANIAKGLIYNYFNSKEALLEAVIIEGMRLLKSYFAVIFQEKTPELKLISIIDSLFEIMLEDPLFWRLYFAILMQPDLPLKIKNIFADFINDFFQILENIFRQIGVADPVAEARIFAAIGDGIILHYWLSEKKYPLKQVKQLLLKKYKQHSLKEDQQT